MMDEAIAQAKERAEARCTGCQMDKRLNFGKLQLPPRQRYPDHTCHGDLAAVRDVALADPLKMLEALAKMAQGGRELPLTGEAIVRLYHEPSSDDVWELTVDWGCAPIGWNEEEEPAFYYYCNSEYSSREEAAALLAGKGDTHDA